MDRSATPLKVVLGGLAVIVVIVLALLVSQAVNPTIKNPQPVNGATMPKGDITVVADVYGVADLQGVQLAIDGKPVQPVIVSHSQRYWTIRYQAALPKGRHEAALTATDQRGRRTPYTWDFTASGPVSPPKFANPMPRPDARLDAGEAQIALAASSDDTTVKTFALELNGAPLATATPSGKPGERTTASQRQTLAPGKYTVHATATDAAGTTATYDWSFTVVAPGATGPDAPTAHFFPETGYYVYEPFLSYWNAHGGLAINGLPISPDFEQGGLTLQWFERARFERHPELPAGQQVVLGRLGAELRQPDPPLTAPPGGGRRFFPETGHSLGGRFLAYWDSHGGLAQFGLPLTEEVTEGGLTVQWFERARFEYHPEYAGTPAEVELTQLGRQLWERGGGR